MAVQPRNNRVIACLLAAAILAGGAAAEAGSSKGESPGTGRIEVLKLSGTFREMGRQYGASRKALLRDFLADMKKLFVTEKGMSQEGLYRYARGLYETYPQRFKEILIGMSETSGMPLDDHMFINAFEHFLFHPDLAGGACAGIAAWGPAASGGGLVFGRNYDFGADVSAFNRYIGMTVFDPAGSGIPTAMITYAGTLNATTLMNSAGIFLELNNGGASASGLSFMNRMSAPVGLLAIMLDSSSIQQVDREMNTLNTGHAYIINVADAGGAVSYEWAPFGLKKITGDGGVLVSTNHFVGDWGFAPSTDAFFLTVTRRNNLKHLAEGAGGKINVEKMKGILNTAIRDGGATSYKVETINGHPSPFTAYQVIAEPGSRRLWIRIPGWQDWTAYDPGK